eukprot:CAMPEP_0175442182 /NCGR_PEP_ID=MMETSP0095-20121207/58012_1 /TAXON_ID=311494 /ORGANISM="Alexandrium monilatum, Strain CCMP3105" /LENGTH=87 /DNA_ID=CAMNT_0016742195 /DNA_START=41 /DNA_END=301 /DNA_ORIENTATION=+
MSDKDMQKLGRLPAADGARGPWPLEHAGAAGGADTAMPAGDEGMGLGGCQADHAELFIVQALICLSCWSLPGNGHTTASRQRRRAVA